MKFDIEKHVKKVLYGTLAVYVVVFSALIVNYYVSTSRALGDGVQQCRCVCERP